MFTAARMERSYADGPAGGLLTNEAMNKEKFLVTGALGTILGAVFLVAVIAWLDAKSGSALTETAQASTPVNTYSAASKIGRQFRGIWLQVHSNDPRCPFEDYVKEIAGTGADTICLAVAAEQEKAASNSIYCDVDRIPSDQRLAGLIRLSHSLGKRVIVMPLVLLTRPAGDEWRGKINPDDWEDWWTQYDKYVLHYAQIAQENGVAMYMVGSELLSTESQEARWRDLIGKVRKQNQDYLDGQFRQYLRQTFPTYKRGDFQSKFGIADIDSFVYSAPRATPPPAELVTQYETFAADRKMLLSYSSNWDHYTVPKWWDILDAVGMTSYYDMNPTHDTNPSVKSMVPRWEAVRRTVAEWQARTGKPVIFTEVGCPSQTGCSTYPWNYYNDPNSPNMVEQRNFVESFLNVFGKEPWVGGILIWKWRDNPSDMGGPQDSGYTPFRKPAMEPIQAFFSSPLPSGAPTSQPSPAEAQQKVVEPKPGAGNARA